MTKLNENLVGKKYGFLTILRYDGVYKYKTQSHTKVICKCKCGSVKDYRLYQLKNGTSTSCGCRRKQFFKNYKGNRGIRHGKYNRDLCNRYYNMISRCEEKTNSRYKSYGGRGIKICEEWKNNIDNFCEWAINNGYKKGLLLDRSDNDGNYEPSNCRFINPSESQLNRRNTLMITHNNITQPLKKWAKEYNISYSTLQARRRKQEPISEYFFRPPQTK